MNKINHKSFREITVDKRTYRQTYKKYFLDPEALKTDLKNVISNHNIFFSLKIKSKTYKSKTASDTKVSVNIINFVSHKLKYFTEVIQNSIEFKKDWFFIKTILPLYKLEHN